MGSAFNHSLKMDGEGGGKKSRHSYWTLSGAMLDTLSVIHRILKKKKPANNSTHQY